MQLRPYQIEAVNAVMDDIENGVNPLIQMPTGSGKSEIMFEVARRVISKNKDNKVCILLNRVMLLDQTIKRLSKMLPSHMVGSVCGTRKYNTYAPITIATIESIKKDMSFDLVICDEARYVSTSSGSSYSKFLNHQKCVMAVDATPWRYDGYIYGKGKMWEKVTYTKPIEDMINEGYLVKPVIKTTIEAYDLNGIKTKLGDYEISTLNKRVENNVKISKQVNEVLLKAQDRNSIVWVCSSINHAEMVAIELDSRNEKVEIIHSMMNDAEIIKAKERFEQGRSRHVVSVSMLISGIDIPRIDCIVMCRPTKSSSLWVQCIGRGLRPFGEKQNCLVIDFGRCAENCGPVNVPIVRKGGSKRGQVLQAAPPMKFCPQCLSYIGVRYSECPDCHYTFPTQEPTKNLTAKASSVDVLRQVKKEAVIVDISPIVQISMHQGKKQKCVKIVFSPISFISRKIYEYAFNFDINKKFKRLGIDGIWRIEDAMKYDKMNIDSGIKKLKVDYSGEYPKILDVYHD